MKALLPMMLLVAVCAVPTAVYAQDHGGPSQMDGHGPGGQPGPGGPHHFYGDFGHFGPADQAMWQGGGWHHEFIDGRWGWWWVVDGLWYWYDAPIYPYPGVVSVTTYAPPPPPPAPRAVVERPVHIAAAPRFRYFCPDRGYYPEVQTCPTDFVRQPIP